MADATIPLEPIYKGATRPPSIFGVPLVPFLLVAGAGFLGGTYLLVFASAIWTAAVGGLALCTLLWMRGLTSKDDQRLRQALLSVKLSIACPNRSFWCCRAYSPLAYRGCRDAWRH